MFGEFAAQDTSRQSGVIAGLPPLSVMQLKTATFLGGERAAYYKIEAEETGEEVHTLYLLAHRRSMRRVRSVARSDRELNSRVDEAMP